MFQKNFSIFFVGDNDENKGTNEKAITVIQKKSTVVVKYVVGFWAYLKY